MFGKFIRGGIHSSASHQIHTLWPQLNLIVPENFNEHSWIEQKFHCWVDGVSQSNTPRMLL